MRSQQIVGALLTAGLDRQDKEWGSFGKIDVDSPLMFDADDPVLRFGLALWNACLRQRTPRQCAAGAQRVRSTSTGGYVAACSFAALTGS